MSHNDNKSEIARIKAQIEAEQKSAWRAMNSSAYGTAVHQFITARLERMAMLHEHLKDLVGAQEAAKALKEALDKEVKSGNNGKQ